MSATLATVDVGTFSRVEKLAALLVILGPESAGEILKGFSHDEIAGISAAMAAMPPLDHASQRAILREFSVLAVTVSTTVRGGADVARHTLERALGETQARQFMGRVSPALGDAAPMHAVAGKEPLQLFKALKDEQPQTIAQVLSFLDPKKATMVLNKLDDDVRDHVIERVATLGPAPSAVVDTVAKLVWDLVPFIILFDSIGNELAHGVGSLASSQPAGTYYIQVQPDSGSGFYFLKLKQLVVTVPTVTTTASPATLNVGETALVTVALSNVPAEGYTSAEFTCTYDATLLEVSNIVVTDLFGADAAVAINGPQNGTFIVAIAGSNGNKATASGTVFTFNAKGLLAGQSAVDCTARVSKGDNVLTSIEWVGSSVTVVGSAPTETPTPFPTFTSTPDGSPAPTLPPPC